MQRDGCMSLINNKSIIEERSSNQYSVNAGQHKARQPQDEVSWSQTPLGQIVDWAEAPFRRSCRLPYIRGNRQQRGSLQADRPIDFGDGIPYMIRSDPDRMSLKKKKDPPASRPSSGGEIFVANRGQDY